MSWFFLQIKALDLNFLIRPNSLNFGTVRIFLCCKSYFLNFDVFRIVFFDLSDLWVIAYVWLLLLAYDRLTGVWRVELSGVMSANHLHQLYKASSHFDHIPFIPSFYALDSTLKHCMSRIDNMWVLGSSWWGRTYYLFYYQTLGSYFYVMLILLCYARRRGLGLSLFMTDVRLFN